MRQRIPAGKEADVVRVRRSTGPRNIAAVRLKAERVKTLRGPGEPARDVPDGLVHRLDNADEPLCGAAVTPLYLLEWEWDQLNDLMQCPVCATLAQTGP